MAKHPPTTAPRTTLRTNVLFDATVRRMLAAPPQPRKPASKKPVRAGSAKSR
jgi:hypothetical protein